MTKPRLAIGTYGSIAFTTTESGQVQAATRFRDEDGTVRRVRATGVSRSAADRALKARIATRRMHGEFDDITGDTSFAQLATMWLADIRDEGRLSLNTQSLYDAWLHELRTVAAYRDLHRVDSDTGLGNASSDAQLLDRARATQAIRRARAMADGDSRASSRLGSHSTAPSSAPVATVAR